MVTLALLAIDISLLTVRNCATTLIVLIAVLFIAVGLHETTDARERPRHENEDR